MIEVALMIGVGVILASVVWAFVTNALVPGIQLAQYSYYHTLDMEQAVLVDPLGDDAT